MSGRFRATLWPVDSVVIGSVSGHLRLSTEPDDPGLVYLVADLVDDGLSATKRVYAHYASGWRDLAAFFAGLATHWRGWSGTREWTSIESDLKIEAVQDGNVRLHVTMRGPLVESDWRASPTSGSNPASS